MMTDVARGLRADLNSFRVAIDRARLIFALALDFLSHTSNLYCAVLVHSVMRGAIARPRSAAGRWRGAARVGRHGVRGCGPLARVVR